MSFSLENSNADILLTEGGGNINTNAKTEANNNNNSFETFNKKAQAMVGGRLEQGEMTTMIKNLPNYANIQFNPNLKTSAAGGMNTNNNNNNKIKVKTSLQKFNSKKPPRNSGNILTDYGQSSGNISMSNKKNKLNSTRTTNSHTTSKSTLASGKSTTVKSTKGKTSSTRVNTSTGGLMTTPFQSKSQKKSPFMPKLNFNKQPRALSSAKGNTNTTLTSNKLLTSSRNSKLKKETSFGSKRDMLNTSSGSISRMRGEGSNRSLSRANTGGKNMRGGRRSVDFTETDFNIIEEYDYSKILLDLKAIFGDNLEFFDENSKNIVSLT
jgi:hypothetical protein